MLNKNFSSKSQNEKPAQENQLCQHHTSARHWLPRGSTDHPDHYLCEACTPPPAPAFVSRWHDDQARARMRTNAHDNAPSLAAGAPTNYTPALPIIVNYERPACPTCHCRWIVEVDTQASLRLQCWSCKKLITHDELSTELSKPKPTSQAEWRRCKAVDVRDERRAVSQSI